MKRVLIALLAMFLIAGGCSRKPEHKATDLFGAGLQQLDKFEFAKADSTFMSLEKADTASREGAYGRGLVMERKLQWYDALMVYLKLADEDPQFAPALQGAARIFGMLGEYAEIPSIELQCVRISPTDPVTRFRLAQAYVNVGQLDSVTAVLDSAVTLGLDKEVADLLKARMFLLQGQPDLAEQVAGQVLAQVVNSPEYFVEAADYLEARGYLDSAVAMSRRSQSEGEGYFDHRLGHFLRCLRTGYLTEARGMIGEFRRQDKTDIVPTGLELFYSWSAKDHRLADLMGSRYQQLVGPCYSGNIFDARSRELMLNNGAAEQELRDIFIFLEKTHATPEFADYMRFRASLMLAGLSDHVGALSKLALVTSWRANLREFKLALAENLYQTGQWDAYNALRDSILQLRGDRTDWLTGLGDVASNTEIRLYGDAEKYYQKALEINPKYRPAFKSYVKMFTDQREYDKALGLYTQYPFFGSFYPRLAITKATCLAELDSLDTALNLFEQNFPLVKGDLHEFDRLSEALSRLGADSALDRAYTLLMRFDPEDPGAIMRQADRELETSNYQAAFDQADRLYSHDTTLVLAEVLKARALYGLGQRQRAMDLFEQILTKNDGDPAASVAFSRILASEKIDPKRAGNLARMAFMYDPSLRTQMNICYVYSELGRYDLSRGEALKAIGNFPHAPEPLFYLGLAMSHEGNPDARKNLEKAIAMGLRGDNLRTAQGILGKN